MEYRQPSPLPQHSHTTLGRPPWLTNNKPSTFHTFLSAPLSLAPFSAIIPSQQTSQRDHQLETTGIARRRRAYKGDRRPCLQNKQALFHWPISGNRAGSTLRPHVTAWRVTLCYVGAVGGAAGNRRRCSHNR